MKKRIMKILITSLAIIMLTVIYMPVATASNGDIKIEIMVRGFGNGPPLKSVKVFLFNNTKTTGSDGKVVFKVKGPPPQQSVTESMQIDGKNVGNYGRVTTKFILSPNTNFAITPVNNPGYFNLDIEYNLDTDVIIINTEVTQSNDLDIISVDFIQNPNTNNQNQQPQQNQPPQGQKGYDPDMPGGVDPGFNSGMGPIPLGLIIAVAVLLIIVITMLIRNSVNKKKE